MNLLSVGISSVIVDIDSIVIRSGFLLPVYKTGAQSRSFYGEAQPTGKADY